MQCSKCSMELQPILPLPGLRRLSFPHVCKMIPKLGPAYASGAGGTWSRGQDWMPSAYGDYYAQSPAVYAAVKLRADATASVPLIAYRRLADGDREPLDDAHPLTMLITKVNPFWTNNDLLRATSIYLDLWGSAFWMLKKAGPTSEPTEVWIMRPDQMRIIPSQTEYIAGYWYQTDAGARIPFRVDEIVWLRQLNPLDEYSGLSPIAPARLSIDMGKDGLTHNRNIFKNGVLSGNLAFTAKDASFTVEQAKEFREALRDRYTKPENSHIPLILGNFEAKNLGLTNRDMEFMAALRWSLEDVGRVYSVPLPMLGDFTHATYANVDAAERIFWRSSMVPHLRLIESELNEMLAPMFGPDIELAFDLSDVTALQEDANAVAMRQLADVQAGIVTINEVREQRGMEPVPWGDVAWMPMGIQPIENPEDAQGPLPPLGTPPPANDKQARLPAANYHTNGNGHTWRKYHEPEISDSYIDKVLQLHERALTRRETDFRRMQVRLFDAQRSEVLRRVRSRKMLDGIMTKDIPVLELFNLGEWIAKYLLSGLPVYVSAANTSAQQQNGAFSLGVSFDIRKMQPWLDQRAGFWAARVNEETGRLLLAELNEALAQGESIRKIQDRVERVFDFSDAVRSERIARTETQSAMNEAAVETYRQSGVVDRKIWLAALDNRTRDTHREAHRQVVALEANFLVGGESISHPGEGSPENAINCRCTVAPIVSQRSLMPPAYDILQTIT